MKGFWEFLSYVWKGSPVEQVVDLKKQNEELRAKIEIQRLTEENQKLMDDLAELKAPAADKGQHWNWQDYSKQVQ